MRCAHQRRTRRPEIPHGFTLVEMLVAMVVLAVIVALFGQVIGQVSHVTADARKRLDSNDGSRIALDVIGGDLAGRVRRPDVDFLVSKRPGNDAFYFYGEAPAYSGATDPASTVALIGYRITSADFAGARRGVGLERIGQKTLLEGAVEPRFFPKRLDDTVISALAETAVQPLSEGVIRLELEFFLKDGSFRDTLPSLADANKPDYRYVSANGSLGLIPAATVANLEQVSAVVVNIVALDEANLAILSESQVETLAAKFPDALAPSTDPGAPPRTTPSTDSWRSIAEKGDFQIPALPAGAVRVYRRYFVLND